MTSKPPEVAPEPVAKAPYASPSLKVYGDLAQLTQTVGRAGNADGGSAANGKNFTH